MTPQEALDEAKKARHDLLTGASAAEITDQNGEKIRYRAIDLAKLNLYIAQLETEIGGVAVNVGPMRIWGRS